MGYASLTNCPSATNSFQPTHPGRNIFPCEFPLTLKHVIAGVRRSVDCKQCNMDSGIGLSTRVLITVYNPDVCTALESKASIGPKGPLRALRAH